MAVGEAAFGAYSATYWDEVWSIDVEREKHTYSFLIPVY